MIRYATTFLLATALCARGFVATAQDGPVLMPTRDVTVIYQLSGADKSNGAGRVKVSYADHNQRVRLDLFGAVAERPFGSIIYDEPDNHVLSLVPAKGIYYQVPATGRANPGLLLNGKMQYVRIGTATVAGLSCTDWRVSNGDAYQGTACVTVDGVALRATRTKPAPGAMEAVAVDYGTPPPTTFAPDPGLTLAPSTPSAR